MVKHGREASVRQGVKTLPLSSEHGTYKTVRTRCWSWLSNVLDYAWGSQVSSPLPTEEAKLWNM